MGAKRWWSDGATREYESRKITRGARDRDKDGGRGTGATAGREQNATDFDCDKAEGESGRSMRFAAAQCPCGGMAACIEVDGQRFPYHFRAQFGNEPRSEYEEKMLADFDHAINLIFARLNLASRAVLN